MSMSAEHISLVKKTWSIFRRIDPVLVGDVFYEKLFSDYPALRKMFRSPRMEQSAKLIDMLNVMVGRLDALDTLSEDVRSLARRHVQYGVRAVHFEPVGLALLWTLRQGLGTDWNPTVEAAWRQCYSTIAGLMADADQRPV